MTHHLHHQMSGSSTSRRPLRLRCLMRSIPQVEVWRAPEFGDVLHCKERRTADTGRFDAQRKGEFHCFTFMSMLPTETISAGPAGGGGQVAEIARPVRVRRPTASMMLPSFSTQIPQRTLISWISHSLFTDWLTAHKRGTRAVSVCYHSIVYKFVK